MDAEPRRLTLPQALEHARERVRRRIRHDRDRARHADLRRFLEYLAVHVFDEDLSLSRLRASFPAAMWAAFARELGANPGTYKVERKLEGVAWLLRRTNVSVFYLVDFAGYSGLAALESAFRRWTGETPTDYRKDQKGDDVIEIVADEMETDEHWWKATLGLLNLAKAMRLFTRMVQSFPFLDPCRNATCWPLRARGHDKAELVPTFEAVWHEIRQLPGEAQLEALRERIETDTADFFHFLCEKSLVEGRSAPDRGVEVMELARVHLRANAMRLGAEAAGLEVVGVARLGNAHIVASRFADAEKDFDAAARAVLGHQNEPRLTLVIHGNLATSHVLADELADAETHLVKAKALCDALADRLIRQHLNWTQALICVGRGDLEAAAIELEEARTGFKGVDQPGYAAMAALELAMIRLDQRRFEEVVALAVEAIPVLEHFRHATGVAAALALLREGLTARRITREVLVEARKALHFLWRDPSLDLGAFKGENGPGSNRPRS